MVVKKLNSNELYYDYSNYNVRTRFVVKFLDNEGLEIYDTSHRLIMIPYCGKAVKLEDNHSFDSFINYCNDDEDELSVLRMYVVFRILKYYYVGASAINIAVCVADRYRDGNPCNVYKLAVSTTFNQLKGVKEKVKLNKIDLDHDVCPFCNVKPLQFVQNREFVDVYNCDVCGTTLYHCGQFNTYSVDAKQLYNILTLNNDFSFVVS